MQKWNQSTDPVKQSFLQQQKNLGERDLFGRSMLRENPFHSKDMKSAPMIAHDKMVPAGREYAGGKRTVAGYAGHRIGTSNVPETHSVVR